MDPVRLPRDGTSTAEGAAQRQEGQQGKHSLEQHLRSLQVRQGVALPARLSPSKPPSTTQGKEAKSHIISS